MIQTKEVASNNNTETVIKVYKKMSLLHNRFWQLRKPSSSVRRHSRHNRNVLLYISTTSVTLRCTRQTITETLLKLNWTRNYLISFLRHFDTLKHWWCYLVWMVDAKLQPVSYLIWAKRAEGWSFLDGARLKRFFIFRSSCCTLSHVCSLCCVN